MCCGTWRVQIRRGCSLNAAEIEAESWPRVNHFSLPYRIQFCWLCVCVRERLFMHVYTCVLHECTHVWKSVMCRWRQNKMQTLNTWLELYSIYFQLWAHCDVTAETDQDSGLWKVCSRHTSMVRSSYNMKRQPQFLLKFLKLKPCYRKPEETGLVTFVKNIIGIGKLKQ